MAKRLNHGNLSFKTFGKEIESAGSPDKFPQSIDEMQKEIDECDLCQNLKPGFCVYHNYGHSHFTNN